MLKFFAGLGVGTALLLLVGGAYFVGKGQFLPKTAVPAPVSSPVQTPVDKSVQSVPVELPASRKEYVNPSVTIAAIEEAVPAKKYADLAPYMAENVNTIIYASSCCGMYTKEKAIQQMSYLDKAVGPWDFSDTNPNAPKMRAASAYFKDYAIGTSSNKYGVGFHLNDKYLIDGVTFVVDYTLLTQP